VPELPEVETIARQLRELVVDRTISDFESRWVRLTEPEPAEVVAARLRGRRISSVRRRGKFVVFDLDGGDALVISLRMTGKLLYGVEDVDERYVRGQILFSDGTALRFSDTRKFGRMAVVDAAALETRKDLRRPKMPLHSSLGQEPLARGFTPAWLRALVRRRPRAAIKVLLLDQRAIAGIGNIYAIEALWRSRDIAAYAQDQWTIRQLTLNLGVRFDNFNGYAPETSMPAGPWVPAREFPRTKNAPNWTNLNPRFGGAYDLFGNGKTAVKASLGRYTPYAIAAVDIPANNQATSTTRTWNDANGNYVPDCDLRSSGANGECGGWSDLTFGQIRAGSTHRVADALGGYNRQDYNWQAAVQVQRELRPNVALNAGYFRTWYGNFLVTDNQATAVSDFDPFCVTAPTDQRLPGGGGNRICGLYDIKPAAFGRVDHVVTQHTHYGMQHEVYNGVDLGIEARLSGGARLQAGVGMGRTMTDTCDFNSLPQVLPTNIGEAAISTTVVTPRTDDFCHISRPWTSATGLKLVAIYPLPWDFQFSALYFDKPGIPIVASRAYTNAEIRQSLGRDLGQCRGAATCNASVVIGVTPDASVFEQRLRQMDIRFSRGFRLGKTRIRGNGDLYNLFNASNVLNMTTRYSGTTGGQWLRPLQILGGRMFKFSAQFDF